VFTVIKLFAVTLLRSLGRNEMYTKTRMFPDNGDARGEKEKSEDETLNIADDFTDS